MAKVSGDDFARLQSVRSLVEDAQYKDAYRYLEEMDDQALRAGRIGSFDLKNYLLIRIREEQAAGLVARESRGSYEEVMEKFYRSVEREDVDVAERLYGFMGRLEIES